ncbi:MAG: dicarboxylate/amino acid:cation symporter, partial [Porticoccaceae bacterium]
MTLSSKIILGMVLGVVVGLVLNAINAGSDSGPLTAWLVEYIFDVVGRIFIASLKLLVVPLVF